MPPSRNVASPMPFGDVEGSIAALQDNIAKGVSVNSSRGALRALLRSQAGYHFDTDPVTERCDKLRLLAEQPECSAADKQNIAAVIHDYEQGMCLPQPGTAIVYFAGKRMVDKVRLGEISIKDNIDKWTKLGHIGRILVETVQHPKSQLAASTTYPNMGPHGHNTFFMNCRRIGGGFWFPLMCLEDTGSSYFSIYQLDDVPLLGINQPYDYYLLPEVVVTANGNIYCHKVLLELQIAAFDGSPIGITTFEECLIMPGHSGDGTRLSGQKLHRTLFVGSAPDNTSRLYAAAKKHGLVRKLPVI